MNLMTPEELEHVLTRDFPPNANCWSQATDEVRDMCREARILADVPDSDALNFRALSSPAQWNSQGVTAIVRFYKMLDSTRQQQFCDRFESWLISE